MRVLEWNGVGWCWEEDKVVRGGGGEVRESAEKEERDLTWDTEGNRQRNELVLPFRATSLTCFQLGLSARIFSICMQARD